MDNLLTLLLFLASTIMLIDDFRSGRIHYTRGWNYFYYYHVETDRFKLPRRSKNYSIWKRRMPFRYWVTFGIVALSTLVLLPLTYYADWVENQLPTTYAFYSWLPFLPGLLLLVYLLHGIVGRLSLRARRHWRKRLGPAPIQEQTLGLANPLMGEERYDDSTGNRK